MQRDNPLIIYNNTQAIKLNQIEILDYSVLQTGKQ